MPVFNIPLDRPRPIRGSLITEAARLKAKKDKEKKAERARRAAQTTPGVTTSSQTDIRNAKARGNTRSLVEKTSRSAARSISLKSDKMTLVQKQEKARMNDSPKLATTSGDKELLTVIEPKMTLAKQNNRLTHDNKGNVRTATIMGPASATSLNKLRPTKVINEKFKTVVPSQNISRTLKVTGLTETELNNALKMAASKTKNTILKDLTKQMVQKPVNKR